MNNLSQFEYVLHPKAGGLQVCMKMAKEKKMIVHDITIGYEDHIDGKRTSELSLLRGSFSIIDFCCLVFASNEILLYSFF